MSVSMDSLLGRLSPASLMQLSAKRRIGDAVCLMDVGDICIMFDISRRGAFSLLKSLQVPIVYVRKAAYFNLYALEKVLMYLMRPGSSGFAAPNSKYKNAGRHLLDTANKPAIKVTKPDVKTMNSPAFLLELSVYRQRRPAMTLRNALKKFEKGNSGA